MSIPLPPLDPTQGYRFDTLKNYPRSEVTAWEKGYERFRSEQRKAAEVAQAVQNAAQNESEMQSPIVERDPSGPGANVLAPPIAPALEMAEAGGQQLVLGRQADASGILYNTPAGPARPARPLVARHELSRPKVGDSKLVLAGYKQTSLCNTLVADALQRAYMAIDLLDKDHAKIIRARLAKAGITNSNASHVGEKDITFKKAVSIASQAEQWVYQAQARAAKSMAKHSKRCAHNIAGRPRLTTAEKEKRYFDRYGVARGTRTDRAIRKHQKKAAEMSAWKAAPVPK